MKLWVHWQLQYCINEHKGDLTSESFPYSTGHCAKEAHREQKKYNLKIQNLPLKFRAFCVITWQVHTQIPCFKKASIQSTVISMLKLQGPCSVIYLILLITNYTTAIHHRTCTVSTATQIVITFIKIFHKTKSGAHWVLHDNW